MLLLHCASSCLFLRYYALLSVAAVVFLVGLFIFFHRSNNPVQSMAYKDGRMAYVWFEARLRLAKVWPIFMNLKRFGHVDVECIQTAINYALKIEECPTMYHLNS